MTGALPHSGHEEVILHGLDLSYFTGKVQVYLQYAEIPHHFEEMSTAGMRRAAKATGLAQMPAIEWPDGRWMTDSTAIIGWYDAQGATDLPVTPTDPVLAYMALLVEDYADEWLWRPALHYRWTYEMDARHMGHRIAAEMMRDVPLPLFARQALIIARQRRKYLREDGVTISTIPHVESVFRRNLIWLEAILSNRPFLLGGRPSLADFGYFASMFRHFGLDPTPSRIMRETAPNVFAWLSRMWAARASRLEGTLLEVLPDDWSPILGDIGTNYLPYLAANAQAYQQGRNNFNFETEGVRYALTTHRYRVWCLDRLQHQFESLPPNAQARVQEILTACGAWSALWTVRHPRSGFDPHALLPFVTKESAWVRP